MKSKQLLIIISMTILVLTACGEIGNEAPPTAFEPVEPTKETPLAGSGSGVNKAANAEVAPTEGATADAEAAANAKVEPTESTTATAEATDAGSDSLPAPTLFTTSWDDLEPFRAGLLASEQGVIDELTGASKYYLDLRFDELATVSGALEVLYTNQEDVPLNEIYFHLFANRLGGSISIADVSVNGQTVEPGLATSVLRVPLVDALDPGEKAVVRMTFETTVPPEDQSTKYNILALNEDILALAHFYPMIATYDAQGWHIEPSPPHGDETYADMSYYLVRLTAPAEQIAVASGIEIDRSESGSMRTITLAAGPVRDFYVAMSNRFDVVSEEVDGVLINSYAPRELIDGAALALEATGKAVRTFSERFGPYPYRELDVVSTPTQALGVEYPGVFANAIRIYDVADGSSSGVPNTILLESTSAHETAHQWFYNLVGNDQLNEPWLDEATSQYATWMYFVDQYGEGAGAGYYDSLSGRWARTEFADIPIGLPAEDYSGQEYGAIVYGRGPIFLDNLAQEMGQETFDKFLRDYVATFSWQIATSEDFQALAEQHCECDLSSIFNEAVYAN